MRVVTTDTRVIRLLRSVRSGFASRLRATHPGARSRLARPGRLPGRLPGWSGHIGPVGSSRSHLALTHSSPNGTDGCPHARARRTFRTPSPGASRTRQKAGRGPRCLVSGPAASSARRTLDKVDSPAVRAELTFGAPMSTQHGSQSHADTGRRAVTGPVAVDPGVCARGPGLLTQVTRSGSRRSSSQPDLGRELTLVRQRRADRTRGGGRWHPASTAGDHFAGRRPPPPSQPGLLTRILRVCGETDPAQLRQWLSAQPRSAAGPDGGLLPPQRPTGAWPVSSPRTQPGSSAVKQSPRA
jgi:hypothetical protein